MNIDLYLALMEETKWRIDSIRNVISGKKVTGNYITDIEFCCLQTRKVLELIALGNLVANKSEFEKQKIKFQKFWHAERILNDIEKLNPEFYPKPVKLTINKDDKPEGEFEDLTDKYLTKKDFVKVYQKCGKILHADNPFGSKTEYKYYINQIRTWVSKIMWLINQHFIHIVGDDNIYLIQIQVKGDNLVHLSKFTIMNKK